MKGAMEWRDTAFCDWRRPYMARGDFMLGDQCIVVSHNLPKRHVADKIEPVWPHPLICGVRMMLGLADRPVGFDCAGKIEEEQVVMSAGKMFISPDAYERIKGRVR